jgi:hypothetical protein
VLEVQSTDITNYIQPSEKIEQPLSVTAEAMISRQAQEVQAAMVIAKRFPRNEYEAYNRIMKACERRILAENAMYEYPRGGTKVTGPSIRLAEVLAQNWGNIDFGILELEQKAGESTVMAYAWDLETNVRQTKVFTVKHERKARGSITKLTDPRDIYEMVANQGARRLRACILGIIPGDIVDAAVEKCKETLVKGYKEPLSDRIRKMISVFDKEFQVSQAMLEKFIGCSADAFSENDFVRLVGVYKSLRDGMAKREDYFDIRTGGNNGKVSKTEEEFLKQQNGGEVDGADATDDGVEQSELPLD